jgi:hypothetical protein
LSEKLIEKHSVRFIWNNAGKQESLSVNVNDSEYQSFMANIRWLLGDKWREVGMRPANHRVDVSGFAA